ncbi:MAG: Gfo/Idh/MocA family protein [Bacilli bacterium]
MLTYVVIGYGQRGKFYADCLQRIENTKLVAVCDTQKSKLDLAQKNYNLREDQLFTNAENLFSKGKIADLAIIASMDQDHYQQAIQALQLGYHLMLEKPIAQNVQECIDIALLAEKMGCKVYVCHVLRYAPIFTSIKEMLVSRKFGDVVTISQTEHVGWWHQAHSYVRGNWRKAKDTTPMIVAKCCHDLDLFVWLTGKKCKRVSSFGSLTYYKRENAPEGSADYCYKCKLKDECIYNCLKFYTKYPSFAFASGQYLGDGEDKEAIIECFSKETNPYARCVFKCDNDVVDHQVVNLLFEDDVTAQLTMTAFCEGGIRTVRVHCTHGSIEANMKNNIIRYEIFGKEAKEFRVSVGETFGGHGGGDERMVEDIVKDLIGIDESLCLTSIDKSVMSHLIGFAAEESRLRGGQAIKID